MRLVAAVAAAIVLATACAGDGSSVPPETVEGIIVEVIQEGSAVTGFELEAEGVTYAYKTDPQLDYGFDLLHLNAHAETSAPVVVRSEVRDGHAYATSIEDA